MNKNDIVQALKNLLPHERCDHENDAVADGEGYVGCKECELKRQLAKCAKETTLVVKHVDERHDVPITVILLDTVTGVMKKGLEGYSTYWWTEGNGSCDCNRHLSFEAMNDVRRCLGTKRYKVVLVIPLLDGYTLDDFNRGYE